MCWSAQHTPGSHPGRRCAHTPGSATRSHAVTSACIVIQEGIGHAEGRSASCMPLDSRPNDKLSCVVCAGCCHPCPAAAAGPSRAQRCSGRQHSPRSATGGQRVPSTQQPTQQQQRSNSNSRRSCRGSSSRVPTSCRPHAKPEGITSTACSKHHAALTCADSAGCCQCSRRRWPCRRVQHSRRAWAGLCC